MNQSKFLDAGIYPMFLRSTLKDFHGNDYIRDQVKTYFRYIKSYPNNGKYCGHGMMFYGLPVASGADLLINLIAKKALVCGHSALLLSVEEAVSRYKDNDFSLGQLSEVDFLCLTGIGNAPNTFEKKVLHAILADRYYNLKPTSLLSTVDVTEGETSILTLYGDEVADIIEHRCHVLECAVSRHKKEKIMQSFRKEIFGE